MLKKAIAVLMVQVLWMSASHAISFKSNDKFSFVDKDGEDIAYIECSNIKYKDAVEVQKIVNRAGNKEAVVESVTVKKKSMVVNYSDSEGQKTFQFDTQQSCDINL